MLKQDAAVIFMGTTHAVLMRPNRLTLSVISRRALAMSALFNHWRLYSEAAGYWNGKPAKGLVECIMNGAHIPLRQYEGLARKFDPVDFIASEWLKTACETGLKYIVIITKHLYV